MRGKWTALQCTNNSKMSTERGESDGRQQHKPGSDDITANKTWASTTKGPLLVCCDLHIVLTLSAYQAMLCSRIQSRRRWLTGTWQRRQTSGKQKQSQHENDKCSLIGKKYLFFCLWISRLFFAPKMQDPPHAAVLVTRPAHLSLCGHLLSLSAGAFFCDVYTLYLCWQGSISRIWSFN